MTVPQIFIGAIHVGGYDDLYALDQTGKLDPLLGTSEPLTLLHSRSARWR
jgi:glutaredoxin-related protein